MTTTTSGLQYEGTVPGSGETARSGHHVTVHFTGWLHDADAPQCRGATFDSSKDRNDPFDFPLGGGRVIRGWDEGVQGMQVGGTRMLTIPPELGYGARQQAPYETRWGSQTPIGGVDRMMRPQLREISHAS
jgi:FKBP-type peptidyl-prolyl cis-trans isomerase FkpA